MSRRPNPGILTPAERRVMEGIVQGKSYKQIALEAGIGKGTVKVQASTAFRRIGVSNLLNAVIQYFKMKRRRNNRIGNALWEPPDDKV